MTRRAAVAGLGLVIVGVVLTAAVLMLRSDAAEGEAAAAFGPLPPGYRYVPMEAEEAEATTTLFRESTGARDVAVTLVEAPEERAPVGVAVVAFLLSSATDPRVLAAQLEPHVPLVEPRPKTLAGQPVLSHEGDVTLSSATLWVQGRVAILGYAATTVEVDGVVEALIAGGAWRRITAA